MCGAPFPAASAGLRMQEARGIYRVRRIGGLGSDARVTDTTTVMDVPKSVYRARGYQPDFDKLPWQDEYDAKKSSASNKATGETWSGRGRMAGWLAAKVKGGEKAAKYLVG